MELILAALAVAAILYTYDIVVSGPAVVRVLGTVAVATLHVWVLADTTAVEYVLTAGAAAGFLALLGVALLQWLQVARDAAMMAAMRRR